MRSLRSIEFRLGHEPVPFARENFVVWHLFPSLEAWPAGEVSDAVNPRSHGDNILNSPVAKDILKTLETCPQDFLLLNRGILLLASDVRQYNGRFVVDFGGDSRIRGLADGGTTDAVLSHFKDLVSAQQRHALFNQGRIHVEVVVGLDDPDKVAKLVAGRNTSRQVQSSSLVNAAGRLDWLKNALSPVSQSRIAWEENASGIPLSDFLCLLNPFRPSSGQPQLSFLVRGSDKSDWMIGLEWLDSVAQGYKNRSKLAASLRDDTVLKDFEATAWAAQGVLYLYDKVGEALAEEADRRTEKARPSRKVDAINKMFPPKKEGGRKVSFGHVFPIVAAAHQFCTKERWLMSITKIKDEILKHSIDKFFQATLEWKKGAVSADEWAKTSMNYSTIYGALLLRKMNNNE